MVKRHLANMRNAIDTLDSKLDEAYTGAWDDSDERKKARVRVRESARTLAIWYDKFRNAFPGIEHIGGSRPRKKKFQHK